MFLFWEMLVPLLVVWLQCFQIAAVSSQPLMSLWFLNRLKNTLWWVLGRKYCWSHSGPFIHIGIKVSMRSHTILSIKINIIFANICSLFERFFEDFSIRNRKFSTIFPIWFQNEYHKLYMLLSPNSEPCF